MSSKRIYGLLAEFKGPKELLNATKSVRDEGFIDFDCHTPFPVHGLDDAMGLKRSIVGYIVGIGCFLGASGGLLLQWWSSTIEYPIVISGKPFFSWQAYMIITFVLMILGGSLASLLPEQCRLFLPYPQSAGTLPETTLNSGKRQQVYLRNECRSKCVESRQCTLR